MGINDLPLYHVALARALLVVKQFLDTAEGEKAANAYMAANPGVGLLEAGHGRLVLAHCDDKGVTAGGPPRRMLCSCCGGVTSGRQWSNRDTGHGLCISCVDQCMRGETVESFTSKYGRRGVNFDLQPAIHP